MELVMEVPDYRCLGARHRHEGGLGVPGHHLQGSRWNGAGALVHGCNLSTLCPLTSLATLARTLEKAFTLAEESCTSLGQVTGEARWWPGDG